MAAKARKVAQALTEEVKIEGAAMAPADLLAKTAEVREAANDLGRDMLREQATAAKTALSAKDVDVLSRVKPGAADADEPGPLYAIESLPKEQYDHDLSQIRRRFAKIEQPMAKMGARARYCVVPAGYDPIILEVAKSRGYAILIGDPETPQLGFSLHANRPAGPMDFIDGSAPEPKAGGQKPLRLPKAAATVKLDGIPIEFVSFVQPVSLEPASSSVNAERHLNSKVKTRSNEMVTMALKAGTLHILVHGKEGPRFVFVPITNTVKCHPSAEWAKEEAGRLAAPQEPAEK